MSELAELPERVGRGEVILDLKQRHQFVGICGRRRVEFLGVDGDAYSVALDV